jgi:hypothetical protein
MVASLVRSRLSLLAQRKSYALTAAFHVQQNGAPFVLQGRRANRVFPRKQSAFFLLEPGGGSRPL